VTAVLTLVAPRYVVQVSDRLVTLATDGAAYDARANKSIVLGLRDALMTVSYSGLAYIEGHPTDEWMASKMTGATISPRGFTGPGPQRVPDIGRAMYVLSDDLKMLYRTLPERNRARWYALAAGFQGSRRGKRAIAYEMQNRSPNEPGVFEWWPATPRPTVEGQIYFFQNPNVLTDEEFNRVRSRIREIDRDDFDGAESALVEAVRSVAERSPLVGEDCMSIVIAPQRNPVRCRYLPARKERASSTEGVFKAEPGAPTHSPHGIPLVPEGAPVGYSPLIVARRSVHMPAAMIGSFQLFTQEFGVVLEGPDPGVPQFAMRSQPRPPEPRRS
jgi:hypothetical protein